jgi:N-acetylglucosaminyldiphosphoundecaprenol N-acetyl-beta-D-mannosaminyltransferase
MRGSLETRVGGETVDTVNILGVRVTTEPFDDVVRRVIRMAGAPRGPVPAYVCATSVHGLIVARDDPEFRRILNGAAIVTPDGMPLVWTGRLSGAGSMERVYGPDLMRRICQQSAATGIRHYFYGGADGVAEDLANRFARVETGAQVAGWYTPPFRALTQDEVHDVAERINGSGADIVWVGLSTPKQERWIATIRDRLQVKVLVSVGAAFDFHTGRVRQAPRWLQVAGLEWGFRLTQEPGRLWRRYAYNNPRFVVLASLQLMGLKAFDIGGTRTVE